METFNLYKSQYIAAKHDYLNALTRHRQLLNSDDYSDDLSKDVLCSQAKRVRESAYSSLINAATMMLGYIAHSVYNLCYEDDICALLEGYAEIADADQPTFKFGFHCAVSELLEYYEFRSQELAQLYQQVQFGYVKVNEAVKLLNQAQIPVTDVGGLCDLSDDELMAMGLHRVMDRLKREVGSLKKRLDAENP